MIKKIDHLAVAVADLDREIERYRNIPGFKFLGTEVVQEQQVKVAFFAVGDIHIELTAPTSEESPVAKFLRKRGGGLHHIAYEVDDLENAIKGFLDQGIKMINQTPRRGAGNSRIAFVHPTGFSGVLVELKEKPRKEPTAAKD